MSLRRLLNVTYAFLAEGFEGDLDATLEAEPVVGGQEPRRRPPVPSPGQNAGLKALMAAARMPQAVPGYEHRPLPRPAEG